MKTSETQTEPAPVRKSNAALPSAIPLVLPGVLAFFGRTRKKVRFPDRETAVRGFSVLSRSGHVVEPLGNHTFGCGSPEQVALLNEAGIRYEIVE